MAVRHHRTTSRCTRSDRAVRPAKLSGKYMKDLLHVAAGGVGGLFRRAPVLVVVLGCLVQTVASNARLVPYVKASLAVSTGLVRTAWSR